MPYLAVCKKCNYLVFADSKLILNHKLNQHSLSHNTNFSKIFNITVIGNAEYELIQQLSKTSDFWNTWRNLSKHLINLTQFL
jgi:hypothetical protein